MNDLSTQEQTMNMQAAWGIQTEAENIIDNRALWQAVAAGTARCEWTESAYYTPDGFERTYTVVGFERDSDVSSLYRVIAEPPVERVYCCDVETVTVYGFDLE